MMTSWEQQDGESDAAFEAFACFRDASMRPRNKNAVARTLGKNAALITRWAARWQWNKRARAWDSYLRKQEEEAIIAGRVSYRNAIREESQQMRNQLLREWERRDLSQFSARDLLTWMQFSFEAGRFGNALENADIRAAHTQKLPIAGNVAGVDEHDDGEGLTLVQRREELRKKSPQELAKEYFAALQATE